MTTMANSLVILDFETTGLSPDMGDRAIEIGAVKIKDGKIIDRFQALMNPKRSISPFIEEYTGISNEMLKNAQPCEDVMGKFADFIGDDNLLAHNASFDKRFLDAELSRISRTYSGQFFCSLLVSRRIYPNAPNHKLGSLIAYKNILSEGSFHRALYDSEMTTQLWLTMLNDISNEYEIANITSNLIKKLTKTAKKSVPNMLKKWSEI